MNSLVLCHILSTSRRLDKNDLFLGKFGPCDPTPQAQKAHEDVHLIGLLNNLVAVILLHKLKEHARMFIYADF